MNDYQFTEHYRAHERKLYYFVLGMARNRQEAEDLAAAAWVKAWKHRAQLNGNFKSWLYRIAVNEVKMARRKASYLMEPLENHHEIPAPEKSDIPDEWNTAVQAVLGLPLRLRQGITNAIRGLDLGTSARAQGVSYGTAGRRLWEARQKVRELCQA